MKLGINKRNGTQIHADALIDYRISGDYKQFVLAEENRGSDMSHVRKLIASMQDYGWLDSCPLAVREVGGKFEVRDGQHRLEAARLLGIPVKFVVSPSGQEAIPIADLNKHQKSWSLLDYCKSHANGGNKHYQTLVRFMESEEVNLSTAACLLAQETPRNSTMRNQNFKVRSVPWARKHVKHLKAINAAVPWNVITGKFSRVFVKACLVEGFDPQQLAKRVRKYPAKLQQFATERDLALCLDELYNYRSRSLLPLAHEIKKVAAKNTARRARCPTAKISGL